MADPDPEHREPIRTDTESNEVVPESDSDVEHAREVVEDVLSEPPHRPVEDGHD